MTKLEKISYNKLSTRQKENYNFQKVASALADYGYQCIKLSDDWQTADFIAQHIDGKTFIKVQLKAGLTISKKYLGKNLYVCYRSGDKFFLYPHDEIAEHILENLNVKNTRSWKEHGLYYWPQTPKSILTILNKYRFK